MYYVSPNFKGFNYFLIFKNFSNINYCIAIDRKKLSYHRNKINVKYVNIYKINISVSNSLYNGTIFDTKLIKKIINISYNYSRLLYYDG